mmetsp:Transcript_34102/g.109407  ORF Transcript_34102/g.109407 Transcript_34102/m.109407 type:complete len:331 (-) Transcript_34102:1644-2636(-)
MAGTVLLPTKDHSVVLWNAATGSAEEVRLQRVVVGELSDWAATPDGQFFAATGQIRGRGRVDLWKTASGEHVATLDCDPDVLALSSDGRLVACPTYELTVALYDAATGRCIAVVDEPAWARTPPLSLISVAFSPDSKLVAAGGYDEDDDTVTTVELWDVATGAHLRSLEGHKGMTTPIVFSPDSTRLYSRGLGRLVRAVCCETGSELFEPVVASDSNTTGLALSRDGNHLATFDSYGIKLWNARTGSLHRTIPYQAVGANALGTIVGVAFSPDARRIVVSMKDNNSACFVDTATGRRVGSLRVETAKNWVFAGCGCHFATSPFRPPSSSS